jgi:hypothetical protein
MRIGIVGTGHIGGTLGAGWAARGHEIAFGVRDPKKAEVAALVASIGARARADRVADAAAFGDVLVLATPWDAVGDALRAAGDLKGKVLVDCTNPLGAGMALLPLPEGSGGQHVAARAPGARVVKAFNSAGFNVFAAPAFGGLAADLYLCGDDAAGKATVAELARELGLEPVDCGPLAQARLLEPLAALWISLAYAQGLGREIAFKLLRR